MTETLDAATTLDEEPVFFAAGKDTCFGILTRPPRGDREMGFILLGGGGGATPSTSTGRNRLHVTMCRRLAAFGYHAFRFDYHGRGESTGTTEHFRLDEPFLDDLMGAVDHVRAEGLDRYIVSGSCFGARTALAAVGKLEGLTGLALMSPPLRDFGVSERKTRDWTLKDYLVCLVNPQKVLGGRDKRRGLSYLRFVKLATVMVTKKVRRRLGGSRAQDAPWLSDRNFLQPLASLVERGVPVLFIYGLEDDSYKDWLEARRGKLGKVLEAGEGLIEVKVIPGKVHGFATLGIQDDMLELVGDWASRHGATSVAAVDRKA
ncbi:MAG: alpha/beta fold hydrolase [Actinomycetota bacterium]